MTTRLFPSICFLTIAVICSGTAFSADIMFLLSNEFDLTEGDEAQLEIFEERGDTVDIWDNSRLSGDPDALDVANEADLVYIDESLGSGNADVIIETITPTINNEQFAFDNWFMTDAPTGHGSPDTPDLFGGSHIGTEIEIVNSQHPIILGAGLGEGVVEVYDEDGAIDWGFPAESADILAIVPGFEEFDPAGTIFVYEQGDELIDGSPAPGMRIGFFISDIAGGGINEAAVLTDVGKALLNSTIDYALGISGGDPGDFDFSGTLDVVDVNALNQQIAGRTNDGAYDVTADGLVNQDDLIAWVTELKGTWFGDANLDGQFNSSDLVAVFTAGKFEQDVEASWDEGDWNGDLRFNSGDFVAAFSDGGFEQGNRPPAAVPEPTSCLGLIVGLAFAFACKRR